MSRGGILYLTPETQTIDMRYKRDFEEIDRSKKAMEDEATLRATNPIGTRRWNAIMASLLLAYENPFYCLLDHITKANLSQVSHVTRVCIHRLSPIYNWSMIICNFHLHNHVDYDKRVDSRRRDGVTLTHCPICGLSECINEFVCYSLYDERKAKVGIESSTPDSMWLASKGIYDDEDYEDEYDGYDSRDEEEYDPYT